MAGNLPDQSWFLQLIKLNFLYYSYQTNLFNLSSLLPLQRCHIVDAKSHADLAKHPMFKAVADCSSRLELAVDFFRHLLKDSPTKRMTAAEALQHPYLQDCFQEMQQARQGNPRFKYNSQPTQQRKCGSSKLKKIIGSAFSSKRPSDKHQRAQLPHDLDFFFPPYESLAAES